jgi:predicted Zn-dependent peptidase/outer membrane lipoprotein-sorting protein
MNLKNLPLIIAAAGCLAQQAVLAQVKDYRDLKYPTLPDFKIAKPEVFTLPNGMQVFLMEDHELPLIQVNARIRTGSYFEPADKVGLAGLMGTVQRTGGTSRMTGDEIDDYLAARAASIETGIGGDSGSASLDCLKQDFDDVFKVFNDVLRTPAFAQEKLDLAKVSVNTGIARRNDNVGGITSREIARLVYGPDSPLARMTEYATIKAITRDDLVAWHKANYHPNRILLGVVGDFKASEMRKKIEEMFGGWAKGPEPDKTSVAYRKDPVPGYFFVEKSDINQANIVMAHLGIETRNPDYFAAQVMNEVLSGSFASRMFSNVRSKKGLAYSVYGTLGSSFNHPGLFRAGLQTKLANTTKAIEAVRAEVVGMIETPATAEELKLAKDSILNSFIFNYDSKEKILSQQMTYAYYGLPADYLEQYRANIEKVTAADLARVAKKYLHPDQLAILVVGKAAELDQPLTNLGKVTTVDITIPPPPDSTPKVEKSSAKLEAGRKIWGEVVKALGGDAFKRAEGMQSTMNIDLSMGGQSVSMKQTMTFVFPDKSRQVMSTPMGEQTVVMNGAESFAKMGDKVQPLPASAAQEQQKDQSRNLLFLLRSHDDPALEVVADKEEAVDGVNCRVIATSFKGVESRLWVAPDGKVLKQTYQGNNPITRAPGNIEAVYSDYRAEGPVQIAHKQARRMDGEQIMAITIETFELNPKVEASLFQKPAE